MRLTEDSTNRFFEIRLVVGSGWVLEGGEYYLIAIKQSVCLFNFSTIIGDTKLHLTTFSHLSVVVEAEL